MASFLNNISSIPSLAPSSAGIPTVLVSESPIAESTATVTDFNTLTPSGTITETATDIGTLTLSNTTASTPPSTTTATITSTPATSTTASSTTASSASATSISATSFSSSTTSTFATGIPSSTQSTPSFPRSTTVTSATSNSFKLSSNTLSVVVIGGTIAGSLAFLLAMGALIFCLLRRRHTRHRNARIKPLKKELSLDDGGPEYVEPGKKGDTLLTNPVYCIMSNSSATVTRYVLASVAR